MVSNFFILGLSLVALIVPVVNAEKNLICYYGTWATYRNGLGRFAVEHIDPFLCTHLIYSFVGININGTIAVLDAWLDLEDNWGLGTMRKFNDLKKVNPKLRTLVAVGGWNEGSRKFSTVAQSALLRTRFARDAAQFCETHGFDGLDIDWEYPGQRDGDPTTDRENFVHLLAELKFEFSRRGLLLTAAVAAAESSASISYDIPRIEKYLDQINLMTYDLHGSWDPVTGHNAPLYPGPHDVTVLQQQLNLQSCIHYWLRQGVPSRKLNLGVPLYGRTFTLRSASENGIGAPVSGPGRGGPYTYESGFLGYNEICEKLQFEKWNHCWDSNQQVPFAYSGNQWVGYDDPESVSLKSDFIKRYELAGGMVWSIETDDFHGKCGEKFALLSALRRGLVETDSTTTSTSISTSTGISTTSTATSTELNTADTSTQTSTSVSTTTALATTSTEVPSPFQCLQTGYFRDPLNCAKFYYCLGTDRYEFDCPSGLYFDVTILACNYSDEVNCRET